MILVAWMCSLWEKMVMMVVVAVLACVSRRLWVGLLSQVGSQPQTLLPSVAFLWVLTTSAHWLDFHLLTFFMCICSWTERSDLFLFSFVNPGQCLVTACFFHPERSCSPRWAEKNGRQAKPHFPRSASPLTREPLTACRASLSASRSPNLGL